MASLPLNDGLTDWEAITKSIDWLSRNATEAKPHPITQIMPSFFDVAKAGIAGLGWGAGATKAAASGYQVAPDQSLYNMVNIYGLGGPAGGLTSGGMKAAPWFSAVGRAIESSPLKSAPGEQWLGTIKNTPGVKQEELDWAGLPEWINSQKGPVTKEQVSDFIRANQVDVQEVVKGTPPKYETINNQWGGLDVIDADGNTVRRWPAGTTPEEALTHAGQNRDTTKFSQWQMPGGENYRELVLRLHNEAYRERANAIPPSQKALDATFTVPAAHAYGDPAADVNRLVHVRFNDRVDAQGKKTLFIEEIQSDWHQKGRKEGYREGIPFTNFNAWRRNQGIGEAEGTRLWQEQSGPKWQEWESFRDRMAADSSKVPDAPFKSSWPELSLKRMIKWAADNGYDQIAWTPGKVQAARYDLSKQVESIKVHHNAAGSVGGGSLVEIRPKGDTSTNGIRLQIDRDGKVVATFGGGQFEGKTLDEVVGKEMADKIMTSKRNAANTWGVKNRESGNWSRRFASKAEAEAYQSELPDATRKQTDVLEMTQPASSTFTGVDLQVGGEGMKGFYDKMLVSAANKLGKKYGAKVGVTALPGKSVNDQFDLLEAASGRWRIFDRHKGVYATDRTFRNGSDAEKWLADNGVIDEEVWSLPITDAMRKEVGAKGMPLFSGGEGAAGAAALLQSLDPSRK